MAASRGPGTSRRGLIKRRTMTVLPIITATRVRAINEILLLQRRLIRKLVMPLICSLKLQFLLTFISSLRGRRMPLTHHINLLQITPFPRPVLSFLFFFFFLSSTSRIFTHCTRLPHRVTHMFFFPLLSWGIYMKLRPSNIILTHQPVKASPLSWKYGFLILH